MLTIQENQRLTQVGPGTPMGELMRRYWHPIAAAAELDEKPTKAVRILGEDLVLYKDRSGTLGLIGRLCPHRRVDLSYGIPEEHGLRCMYHGWMMDETGQCIEQPFEETVHPDGRFKEKVKIAGYPVQELAGLVFAYLGPEPAPFLPRWQPLVWENAIRDVAIADLSCNWLQCQENSLDPVHLEWLHSYMGNYVGSLRNAGTEALTRRRHSKIGFDRFEYGVIKRRLVQGGSEEDEDWKEGHPVLFPNILLVGNEVKATLQWRVPVDDTHTYHVTLYTYRAAPGSSAPTQSAVPYRSVPLTSEDGRYITNVTFNQDYMAWITQGSIAQRDKERLGQSDVGIIEYRKLLAEQVNVALDGGDPMNVFRSHHNAVDAPLEKVKLGHRAPTKYIPQEAGISQAVPSIQAVLDGWAQHYVDESSAPFG